MSINQEEQTPTKDLVSSSGWDSTHEGYLRRADRKSSWKQRMWWPLDAMARRMVGDGARVIEVGCGGGRMLERVHHVRPGCQLFGIDYSEQGITAAKQYLDAHDVPVELSVADMFTFEPAQPFDVAFSAGLVEHFEDPSEAIAQHRRFVRPGGQVAVSVPNFAHPVVRRYLERFSPETLRTHNLSIIDPNALAQAMKKAGLTGITVENFGGPWFVAPSEPSLLGTGLRKILPLVHLLSQPLGGMLGAGHFLATGLRAE